MVYNVVVIKIRPSQVALLIKIIGCLTKMITDLPVADAWMEEQRISCRLFLALHSQELWELTGASGTVLPRHQTVSSNTLMDRAESVHGQDICSINYFVLRRRCSIEQKTVVAGFIFFIVPENIFYSKLLKYSYYGEQDQNCLSSERKRAHNKITK